jgi:hypothetical protein
MSAMETTIKKQLLSTDEIIRRWKESRKQSKIEAEKMYQSPEYQAFLVKLRALKNQNV